MFPTYTYFNVWVAKFKALYSEGSPRQVISTAFFRAVICFLGFPMKRN